MSAEQKKKFWQYPKDSNTGGVNASLPGAFFNDNDPVYFLKKEIPVHRKMAEMHLQGFTNREISAELGRTPLGVSNILRQPHIRAHMQEAVKRSVKEEMTEFLDEEVMASLRTMKEIRDNPEEKASDRIAAAKEIADRRLGKPTQPFANVDKPIQKLSKEELEAEVERILKANDSGANSNS